MISLPNKFTPPAVLCGAAENAPVLVAFSGGADSSALLVMLCQYAKQTGGKVFAAHVNHGIRGEEADRDEDFCRKTAEKLGVELFICRRDVPTFAKETSQSIETAARKVRYQFFDDIMKEHDIPILATAHNANDNLETVIFNITRGCGLSGVCGIPPVRPCKNGMAVRPILSMSRDEILQFCADNGLDFVTDSTNTDTDYTRNKIRAEVIPTLLSINSGAIENVARMTSNLREDSACLTSLSDWFFEEMNNDGSFEIEKLLGSPAAVTGRAIMSLYSAVSEGGDLEAVHLSAIRELCEKAVPHSRLNLPGGIDAVIESKRLYLVSRRPEAKPPEDFCVELSRGETYIPQINAKIIIGNSQNSKNIYKNSILLYLDSAKINGAVYARSRKSGDKILLRGVNKQVKKLLCDLHIPLSLRYRLPMICDDSGIIAIPHAALRDGMKNTSPENSLVIQFCLL